MCPKIDMMERECKKLEFGGDLNRPLIIFLFHYYPFIHVFGWRERVVTSADSSLDHRTRVGVHSS
jgi:hypothetical protein